MERTFLMTRTTISGDVTSGKACVPEEGNIKNEWRHFWKGLYLYYNLLFSGDSNFQSPFDRNHLFSHEKGEMKVIPTVSFVTIKTSLVMNLKSPCL